MNTRSILLLILGLSATLCAPVLVTEHLRLATTTSTGNSGLLAALLLPFEQANDCKVDVIAVGTGKAIKLGEAGGVTPQGEWYLEADALITSAGVSAGDRDLVRDVLDEIGVEQLFWKINIKPGRPTAFGLKERTPVFSLPGNPVSTMITFDELVRPALLRMMGHTEILRPLFPARLSEDVKKKKGRLHFLRVAIEERDGTCRAVPSGDQNTGILKTMIRANAIACLPAERDMLHAGEEVDVHLI